MMSVVMCTFNRASLLDRSLHCYASQNHRDFEIIVIDDDSTDDTFPVCRKWQAQLNLIYLHVAKPSNLHWRDCSSIINLGIRASKGDFIIATHPEVMPGRGSLELTWRNRRDDAYICCKPYYLSVADQDAIDSVPWKSEGPIAVRRLPHFYEQHSAEPGGNPDYKPRAIEQFTHWESWVFGGLSRNTWKRIGGMTEHVAWGSIDLTFMSRRRLLGIRNLTLAVDDAYCVHQNHERSDQGSGSTRGDMALASAGEKKYHRPEEAIEHNLW